MTGRIKQIKSACFVLFVFVIISLILVQTNWFWRLIYPLKFTDIILENSREYNVDPHLVAAIIYVESKFKPEACSHKGALGLMQIMPDTGRWIAEQMGIDDFSETDLYDPETNIQFGSWYLSILKEEFNDELIIVLAAYNAGLGNVNKWLEEDWDGRHSSIADLPFPETRNYVNQILKVYKKYRNLYDIDDK
ncbi:MAG: soluble lytic murein transglycosylase [Halanaerobiales bacterium]|nr:soluble lytic murein transglycosylase [Halanaerobiales bacterium]